MKFTSAFLFLTAVISPVAGDGTTSANHVLALEARDRDRNRALEGPDQAHHRRLGTERYSATGRAASVDSYWYDGTCGYYSSYLSLSAQNGVSRIQSNGRPSTTTSEYVYGYAGLYSDCDENSQTYYSLYFDSFEDDEMALTVPRQLGTASFTLNTIVFGYKQTCGWYCYDDYWWGGQYCDYLDCTYDYNYAPVSVSGTWTATTPATTFSRTEKYSNPEYTSRSTYSGKSRQATVSLTVTIDGTAVVIPADASTWAAIEQYTSGSFSKF